NSTYNVNACPLLPAIKASSIGIHRYSFLPLYSICTRKLYTLLAMLPSIAYGLSGNVYRPSADVATRYLTTSVALTALLLPNTGYRFNLAPIAGAPFFCLTSIWKEGGK